MPRKILVAERDETMIEAVCRALKQAGFLPVVARDADAALQHFDAYLPSLSIVSGELGDLNCRRLIRTIRQKRGGDSTPVVVLAATQPAPNPEAIGADAVLEATSEDVRAIVALVRRLTEDGQEDTTRIPHPNEGGEVGIEIEGLEREITEREVLPRPDPLGEEDTLAPVHDAVRAVQSAASEALEESIVRGDALWRQTRAEEERREHARRRRSSRPPARPPESGNSSGRLGALADRLKLLFWLEGRVAGGSLETALSRIHWAQGKLTADEDAARQLGTFLTERDGPWSFRPGAGDEGHRAVSSLLFTVLPKWIDTETLVRAAGGASAVLRLIVPIHEVAPEEARGFVSQLDGRTPLSDALERSGFSRSHGASAVLITSAAGLVNRAEQTTQILTHRYERSSRRPAQKHALEEMWRLVRREDYFAILGVDEEVRRADVESAYEEAIRGLDLEAQLDDPELRGKAEEVLRVLEEAKAVLSVPALRRAYRKNLGD